MDFAKAKEAANDKKAVVRLGQEDNGTSAPRSLSAATTDYVHKWFRSGDDEAENDRTRSIFRRAS